MKNSVKRIRDSMVKVSRCTKYCLFLVLLSTFSAFANRPMITAADIALVKNTLTSAGQKSLQGKMQHASPPPVMLLVSLGMPTLVLQQYARQAGKLGVPLYIRGEYKGSLHATAKRWFAILHPKNKPEIKAGVAIDPVWFERLNIKVVPTLVLSANGRSDSLSGNIPLPHLLSTAAARSTNSAIQHCAKGLLQHQEGACTLS